MLASLQVILGQFLHEEAGGWFPSLHLPAPDELLTMQEVSDPHRHGVYIQLTLQ